MKKESHLQMHPQDMWHNGILFPSPISFSFHSAAFRIFSTDLEVPIPVSFFLEHKQERSTTLYFFWISFHLLKIHEKRGYIKVGGEGFRSRELTFFFRKATYLRRAERGVTLICDRRNYKSMNHEEIDNSNNLFVVQNL